MAERSIETAKDEIDKSTPFAEENYEKNGASSAFNLLEHRATQEARTANYAFRIIIYCLIGIIIIFISSFFQCSFNIPIADKAFEVAKTLLLITAGYLFGKKE